MTTDQARLNLNNFLSSYTLQECTGMLHQIYDHVKSSMTAEGNDEDVLDFLEALEELLPAIYNKKTHNELLRD